MQEAPDKLIKAIQRAHGGLKDDTSVIVLDLLPPEKDFPTAAGVNRKGKSKGGFMCCAACVPSPCCALFPQSLYSSMKLDTVTDRHVFKKWQVQNFHIRPGFSGSSSMLALHT